MPSPWAWPSPPDGHPASAPVQATIVATASATGTVVWGGVLLALYSMGLGIPFVLLTLGPSRAQRSLGWLAATADASRSSGARCWWRWACCSSPAVDAEVPPPPALVRPAGLAADMTVDQTGPPPPDVAPPPGRRRSLRWVALAVAVPLLGLVGVMAAGPLATTRAARSPLQGKAAPAVRAESLDGQALRLADYRGRGAGELLRHRGGVRRLGRRRPTLPGRPRRRVADACGPLGAHRPRLRVAGVAESFLINPAGVVVSRIVGGVRASDLEDLLARAKSPPSQTTMEKE